MLCIIAPLFAVAPAYASSPVTVGIHGNEPLITRAPDGTLYISALQHLYRSTDSGASWTELLGPIYASTLNLNSDSSISVDPLNRLYFTFDYPYAGTTAVCTSDDRGTTWACNPAVVPGGTDRMWILAPHYVGVLYYYTPDNGDPGALTNSTWSAVWAESFNADSPLPTWTVTTVEPAIHFGAICIAASCSGSNRFAGDFINAIIDPSEVAHLTWMKQEGGTGAISIRYQQIQSTPPSKKQPRKK